MSLQPIQIAAFAFAAIHIARILALWKTKKLPLRTAVFWFFVWFAVLLVVSITPIIDALSRPIGVGRGIDLIVYISIMLLFYLVFQQNMKIDKLEQDITKVVREKALKK
jgi:hypothetical protein